MIISNENWLVVGIEVGIMMVNCYIVACPKTKKAVIFDPGADASKIVEKISDLSLEVESIVITHGHGDHIGATRELVQKYQVPVIIGTEDADMMTDDMKNLSRPVGMPITSPPADRLINENDEISIGKQSLKVFHAPGHSPGSMIFVADEFVIVGDVLFAGSIGRTDFPGGSLSLLLRMIREKIFVLDEKSIVLPGHGPQSTVGHEKRTNPFLQPGFNPGLYE